MSDNNDLPVSEIKLGSSQGQSDVPVESEQAGKAQRAEVTTSDAPHVSNLVPACVHFYVNGACIYCKVSNPAQGEGGERCPDCKHLWKMHDRKSGGMGCAEAEGFHECGCRKLQPAVAEPAKGPEKHHVSTTKRMSGTVTSKCICGWLWESNSVGRNSEAADEHIKSSRPSPISFDLTKPEQCIAAGGAVKALHDAGYVVAEPAKGVCNCWHKSLSKRRPFPGGHLPDCPVSKQPSPEQGEPTDSRDYSQFSPAVQKAMARFHAKLDAVKAEQGEQEGTFEAWWDEQIRLAQIFLGSGDYWVSKGIAKKAWQAAQAATVDSRDVDWEQRVKAILFEAIDAWPTDIEGHRKVILKAYDVIAKRTAPKTKDGE